MYQFLTVLIGKPLDYNSATCGASGQGRNDGGFMIVGIPIDQASRRAAVGQRSRVRGSPHPHGIHGSARPGRTLDSTAVGCRSLIRPPWPGAATRDENRVGPLPSSRPRPPHHPRTPRRMTRGFSFQDEAAGSSPARPTNWPVTSGNAGRSASRCQPNQMHPVGMRF